MSKQRQATQNNAPENDPFLTVSEVGRQLNKSPQTISRWCTDGLLTAVRMPSGLWGIRRSQLNVFLGHSALEKQVT